MSIMNRFNKNDNELTREEPWIPVVVEQLRQPLDASVSAQLSAARRTALNKLASDQLVTKSKLPIYYLWGVPTLASVFAIVIAFGLWQEPDSDILFIKTAENAALEDLSIIKASDDLEFYQNLEFLLWMEQADNGLTKG